MEKKAIAEKILNVKKNENITYIVPSLIAPPGNEPCENLDADEYRILLSLFVILVYYINP